MHSIFDIFNPNRQAWTSARMHAPGYQSANMVSFYQLMSLVFLYHEKELDYHNQLSPNEKVYQYTTVSIKSEEEGRRMWNEGLEGNQELGWINNKIIDKLN